MSYLWSSRPIRSVVLRRGLTDSHFLVSSFIQFHPVPYFAMNYPFQDGSFQTAADMLRNQQREFVEPLMQQLVANLGGTLAGSISFAVGQAVQAAQNRDVRPRRESQPTATSQHRLLLSRSSEVQTLLRRYHKEVESRMDKLFAQQAIAENMQSCHVRGKCIETFSPKKTNTGNGRRNTNLWPRVLTSKSSLWTTTWKGRGRN